MILLQQKKHFDRVPTESLKQWIYAVDALVESTIECELLGQVTPIRNIMFIYYQEMSLALDASLICVHIMASEQIPKDLVVSEVLTF